MHDPVSQTYARLRVLRISPLIVSATALLASANASQNASAVLLSWNNVSGGLISTAGNWSPVQVPGRSDDLVFNLTGTFPLTFNNIAPASHSLTWHEGVVTITATSPHTVGTGIFIGDISGDNPSVTLTTGTLTANAQSIIGDAASSSGVLNVNDDDADFIVANAADLVVGNNGDADLNITNAGKVQVADQLIVGSNSTSTPTVNVSGFSFAPAGTSQLIVQGLGQSRIGAGGDVTMTISNGAVADFAGDVVVANGSASVSTVTVQTTGLADARLLVDGDLLLGRNTSVGVAAGDGTVIVNNGGTVDVGGTLFVGGDSTAGVGELQANPGGEVFATNMQVGDGGTLTMTTGTVSVDNPIALNTGGLIVGTGVINADINLVNGNLTPGGADGLTLNGTLFNTTSGLVNGTKLTFGNGGGYQGSGTCVASIVGDPGSLITATGTLSIGKAAIDGFYTVGDLDVGGHIVTLLDSNGAVLGGDTTINSGRIECPAGIGVQNGGIVRGDGLFVGNVTCAGELDPHTDAAAGGLFTIQGNLQMNPTGIIDMEIGGHHLNNPELNDRINISGTAGFDGTVRLRLKPGFTPQRGMQYIVANAVLGRSGTFDSLIAPDNVCNGVTFVLVYSSTAAIVVVRPPDADIDDNGQVDTDDLLTLLANWGAVCSNCPFDVNGVEPVDTDDLLELLGSWGPCPG